MPAITARQQTFISSLASERVTGAEHADAIAQAAKGTLTSSDASALITSFLHAPRVAASAAPQAATGDTVPTPSQGTRAGRMLLAGGIEATVQLLDGRHVTLNVRTRRRVGRGWSNGAPGQDGARTNISVLGSRIGFATVADIGFATVAEDGTWKVTLRTRREEYRDAVAALFAYAAAVPTGLIVREASRCGRCMRTLTDPVSIDRGVGPECFGRTTGSRHVSPATVTEALAAAGTTAAEVNAEADFRALTSRGRETLATMAETQESLTLMAEALTAPVEAAPVAADTLRTLGSSVVETVNAQMAASIRNETPSGVRREDIGRARDLISEALDSYFESNGEGGLDAAFAMRIFDQLAQ